MSSPGARDVASDRWAEVERVYHAALEREPDARAAFVGEACGHDDALRREVQSLLGFDRAAETFLERPALEVEAKSLLGDRAPLLAGRDLDDYRIVSLLGRGGMGDVYRARDRTLGRDVAIKVLHPSAAGGPDGLRRLEEEARLTSALNHPNIVTVFGIGENEGVAYIAMELVNGRPLRELLTGRPMPLKRALHLVAQLADALSAAHARGIVHRDLKPENIMVTADGRLAVLDFGIAKLHGPRDAATDSGPSIHTEVGKILGTVGYMSPEQAAGQHAVFESDQFALGTILYEMLTGVSPWKRDTAAETLTAIIRDDPPPIADAPATPAAVRWILERCLAKDPQDRYGSTRDLARDLSTVRTHLAEISGGPVESSPGDRARRRSNKRLGWVVAACAAVIVAFLLLSRIWARPPQPDWVQIGFRRGTVWSAYFSPGGRTIVYSAAWDGDPVRMFSTRTDATEARPLDLPPGKVLAISAKNEVAFLRHAVFDRFFVQPGVLARAGVEAGASRDVLAGVHAADWSADGLQLAVAREVGEKVRLEYPLGKVLYETDRPISNLRISRDGAWIAFCEGGGEVSVSAVRVSDGQRRVLSEGWFPGATGLAWSANGREIWFTPQKKVRDSSPPILAVTLAGKVREVVRAPGQLRLFDIAPDGRVLIARWDLQLGLRAASPSDGREREVSATDDSVLSDLSSDGRAVVFYDRYVAYLRGTDGSLPLRLGETMPDGRLSPDGKWLLTLSPEENTAAMLTPVGPGEARQIGKEGCHCVKWYPDGKRLLCEISDPEAKFRLLTLDVTSGKATPIPIAEDAARDLDHGGPIAPDGSVWVGVGRHGDLWLVPLEGGSARRISPSAAGFEPGAMPAGWSADGKQLFIPREGNVPQRVERLDLATGRVAPWKELTLEDVAGVTRIGPVKVAADGRAWAYTYVRVLSNLYVVDGLE